MILTDYSSKIISTTKKSSYHFKRVNHLQIFADKTNSWRIPRSQVLFATNENLIYLKVDFLVNC